LVVYIFSLFIEINAPLTQHPFMNTPKQTSPSSAPEAQQPELVVIGLDALLQQFCCCSQLIAEFQAELSVTTHVSSA
jgi:hypothetical protein